MAPNTRPGRHGAPVEPPIGYDRQEEDRIRLEQEIGGLSLDLEHSESMSLSLEYGRHGAPSPRFEGVASFARYDSDLEKSRDASARRTNRYQSFRTLDDSYDGGQTQSTAAHHASGVTVGAGLGYGNGARPASRTGSGAEYDPDRELSSMLKRRGRISLLDDTNTTVRDPSATKKKSVQHISADPLIVDDTAELDHLLETGHIPEHSLRARPRNPRTHATEDTSHRTDADSSFHRSEADDSFSRRKPRLTDALGGAFSPKRPRTNTAASPNHMQHKPLPSIISTSDASVRPSASLLASRPSNIPGGTARTDSSMTSSSATQRARLDANTAANARRAAANDPAPAAAPTRRVGRQNSFEKRHEVAPVQVRTQSSAFPRASAAEPKSRNVFGPGLSIHLPDITGLTMAVASPVKASLQYRDAQVGSPKTGFDADRSAADAQLEQLSDVLRELEHENSTARRRVRELEIELEHCKREVEIERTRVSVQEAERTRENERRAVTERAERERQIRETEETAKSWESRYHDVVEEKQALEALVDTLRSHLARMTSEVEEHQRTIDELRSMRERDVADLEAKTAEVVAITAEVERLAEECDRLRGVVEEGLRERRQVRESGSLQASGSQKDFEGSGSIIIGRGVELSAVQEEEEQTEDEMDASELEGQRSALSLTELGGDDRSGRARTDRATVGSTSRALRFMDPAPQMASQSDMTPELERSQSMCSSRSEFRPSSRSSTPVLGRTRSALATAGTSSPRRESPLARRASGDEAARPRPNSRLPLPPRSESPTPPQRSPVREREHQALRASQHPPPSPPFPRIRGEQLERLFFSVPAHNAGTCTRCCRGQKARLARDDRHEPARARERERANWRLGGRVGAREEEDEGYAHSEGEEDLRVDIDPARPPPQTVLVKVVRELEDDFAHYKEIYVELADQYRIIGPASNVAKRNVLAEHLKEVIDTLEKRGDQIASLYDLISVNDKPIPKQY
ncbi:Cep57 Cep57-MT-bd: centrosome microtubule-binding domain protein [Rhizoctonia solani AG-3 Rhs1AP]|uniref:Cep57 Cep57-MT-bd: centrosome microtubule-binding domain protein n=1 Tax=Rhizoctonia solani AG-3 Rhs1AP TaxID=1086054 RepID=X8IYH6_9AGAM|nr:Cep57 Cep57-MT-bd: centrosome microtubule-binding domain protein [Rhizoctonia solani AG-3 Rhs1AP]